METKVCKCCGKEMPIDSFSKNFHGVTSVCKECNRKHRSESRLRYIERKKGAEPSVDEQIEAAKRMRLEDFQPRDLMLELKRRGYRGSFTFTKTYTINLETLE